jgi:cobalt-zinc-cadmium efflux system outer membrane protein
MAGADGTFPHLSLTEAVALALRDNHDVQLTRLAIAFAEAGIRTADTSPNPLLTMAAFNINPNVGIGSGNLRSKTVDSSIRIDQIIERGGKRALRVENSSLLKSAAQHDTVEVQRQLTITVKQAYFDLLAAQNRLVIVNQSAALSEAAIGAARKRLKAGDIAPSEFARLEVDMLRAQNDGTQAAADVTRARLVLAQLIGVSELADTISLDDNWPAPEKPVMIDIDTVIGARSDIHAATARLQAAEAAGRLALAARTRDITVGVQYDHFPASTTNTLGGGNTYGIAVQIPLFVSNQYDGEIHAAAVAADSARESLAKTRDSARTELFRILADRRSAAERLVRFEENILPAARKAAEGAEFAFLHGAIAIMDVLDVRRVYRLTQLDAVNARADFAKAAASLEFFSSPGERP